MLTEYISGRGNHNSPAAAVIPGIRRPRVCRHDTHLCLRLLERHAWFELGIYDVPPASGAVPGAEVPTKRHPELGFHSAGRVESSGHHADDTRRGTVDQDVAAHD